MGELSFFFVGSCKNLEVTWGQFGRVGINNETINPGEAI